MKKFQFISAIALSALFVSCDGYDLPDPAGESYPEPDGIFQDADFATVQGASQINLQTANEENSSVTVASITDLQNFPAEYTLKVNFEVSGTENFATYAVAATEIDGDNITVTSDAFDGAIREAITKNPAQLTVYGRIAAYAVNGTTTLRLGGNDVYYGTYKYDVKPINPTTVIEDDYYLVGSFCDWDLSQAIKMTNTLAGASPYDNPKFQVKVDVDAAQAAAGYEWKVVPASAVESGSLDSAIGVRANIAIGESGELILAPGKDSGAGVFDTPNPYLISVDIEAMTYSISLAIDNLWVPGVGTSASVFSKVKMLSTTDYINYSGVSPLRGNFWFTSEPNLTTSIQYYGNSKVDTVVEGETQSGGIGRYDKDAEDAGDFAKIKLDTDVFGTKVALYMINVDLVHLTYNIGRINTLSLVGAFNGWDQENAPELTPSSDLLVWTGTFTLDGGEFKINANHAWDIDFGGGVQTGTTYELIAKGNNMTAPAGTYDVTVDFSAVPYIMTLVKK